MENEENRGLINKKASKINVQAWSVYPFVSLALKLSHILFISHTLGHLEFIGAILALDQERKRRQEEAKIK